MSERTRRRGGGAPDDPEPARRRRRGAQPEPEPQATGRRRRRGAGNAPAAETVAAAEPAPPASQSQSQSQSASEPEPQAPERSTTSVATDVTLPQLGESVTEGTITAWLVNVGDHVEADQPLFELSSDKIDTEVPAPASGVLSEILVNVDETVEVGTVVARIGSDGAAGASPGGDEGGGQTPAPEPQPQTEKTETPSAQPEDAEAAQAQPVPAQAAAAQPAPPAQEHKQQQEPAQRPPLMSPLARRAAAEAGVDVSSIQGTGQGGRVTREDVEAAASAGQAPGQPGSQAPAAAPQAQPAAQPQPARSVPLSAGDRERMEDLSRIRQRIAAKMMESMQSAAQLTTVQEADVTRIMQIRSRVKGTFTEREGVSLSPFVFLARAAVIAIKRHEMANAQADWQAGKVRIPEYVNLGIAVDTEKGLLVPNVKNADDLTLPALARAIDEAARKARGELKLEMRDIEGGTFTVTNTGSRGVLLDTPILNYPEVAILATGAIQKRPIVVDTDTGPSIAIRDMVYLCLTYDHRLLDGADAARFVTDVKQVIETHDWESEIGY